MITAWGRCGVGSLYVRGFIHSFIYLFRHAGRKSRWDPVVVFVGVVVAAEGVVGRGDLDIWNVLLVSVDTAS